MRNAVKVLVLDDDRSSGNLLAEVVKRMGFKPMLVTRSLDALNMVKLQTVHAAIVDVLLPKMSGVDIVKEFRKTKFGDAPVVLVSGVFKDKNFAQEAMEKTEAMDFLFKPFGADELMSALEKAFSGLMTSETWTVQSLLTRKLTSEREMAKAVEHMDQLEGMDFPFVLSILMDVGITGHLNIVNDVGEIFGVTLVKGTIADVDSTESQSIGVLALIQKGFLVPEDWDEYQRGRSKRSSLERLVQEGFVSPHAVSVAKHEQILNDFKSICASARMQVTFVPQEDDEEPPKHAVTFAELLGLFGTSLGEFFPHEYLLKFYEPVKEAPIRKEASSKYEAAVWEQEEFRGLKGMRKAVEEGGTLASALTAHPGHERAVLLCMHYLVMSRCIFLDDIERTKSMQVMLDRYRKLYEDLQGRSADRVFEYFGAAERAQPSTAQKIFDEYSRSNHPDLLPKEAPPDLVDLCKKVFNLMSDARDIMVDEARRAELFEELKREEGQRIKRSKELVTDGLELLRKGQFANALEKLREAEKLHASPMQYLIKTWAELKAGEVEKPMLFEILKKLDKYPADDRKSVYYHMVMGLTKKGLGDVSAAASFEKVLELDRTFAEARRELNSMNAPAKDKKLDILHGDITEIVSHLFKRKPD